MNTRLIPLAVLFLAFSAPATAQMRLNLPINAAEMRQYMRDYDNACPTCAIVTNIRIINDDGGEVEYSGVAGPEDLVGINVLIQPIFSSSHQSTRIASARQWRITVRYDNGSYAGFDQSHKPDVRVGDEVQISEGRVQPR